MREVRFGSGGSDIEWEQRVPVLTSANLWLDRRTRGWRLLGRSRDDEIVRIEGTIGESALHDRRWPARDETGQQEDDWVNGIAATHTHVLTVQTHYDGLDNPLSVLIALVESTSSESRFTVIGPNDHQVLGSSRLEVDCQGLARGDERAICAAFDGTSTTFFELDLAAARLEPVGSLPGRFTGSHDGGSDWLNGWWNGGPLAVNTTRREAWRFPESVRGSGVFSIAVADNLIGSISVSGTESVVRLYTR